LKAIIAFAALLLCNFNALAQSTWPEQAIRILVGFPAGRAGRCSRVIADRIAITLASGGDRNIPAPAAHWL